MKKGPHQKFENDILSKKKLSTTTFTELKAQKIP